MVKVVWSIILLHSSNCSSPQTKHLPLHSFPATGSLLSPLSNLNSNNAHFQYSSLKMQQLLFFSLLTLSLSSLSKSQQDCPSYIRAGYWLSTSNHYSPVSSINTSLYTHLYYYSLSVDRTTSAVALPPPDQVPLLAKFSSTLKSTNPSLKTILCIATEERQTGASNAAFSSMAADRNLRQVFVNSTVELAKANAFDGIDLAWKFPASSEDMANFAALVAEWRERIDQEVENSSPPMLLTASVYFSDHLFDLSNENNDYPIDAILDNLDWINVITFGYHKNSNVTAAAAPLYDKASHFSASYGIISWLDAGIPPCKIVMGIPLYGRSWSLKNKAKNGLGAQVVAFGPKQKKSNETGVMAYSEIAALLTESNAVFEYDNRTVSAFFYSGSLWVSFDSLEVVEEKIEFARSYKLLGYFLWPISFDDSNYTVSKQALEVWIKHNDSSQLSDGDDLEQAPAPSQLPPQHHGLTPSSESSGSDGRYRPGGRRPFYLLLFLLFYQSTS
ncbi:nod factor hydrolase protein 1-like [Typha angustifolia]|uniref:nod factor hydrolase protein 1-like n=1 Tax=Typha angustifolia TaxID=59011 RepID=UPI003C2D1328